MKWMLTGVAAMALAASAALAQPGNGNGGGNGGGNGRERGAADHADHGNATGNGRARAQAETPSDRGSQGNIQRTAAENGPRIDRSNDRGNGNGAQRREDRGPEAVQRGNGRDERDVVVRGREVIVRDDDWRDTPLRYVRGNGRDRDGDVVRYVGLLDGCPPGLAAKNNGCLPPGQARKTSWLPRDRYDLGWWGLPRYDRGLYRYEDGYLLRLGDGGRVSAYIPLLGGALAVGNPWPSSYGYDRLGPYYADYYGLGPSYRYADNVVYRLDPETAAITSIAALLTGDDFVVGSRVPAGYDVYNVPYAYRDRYRDRADAYYRYSDGYVYQVDPATRLVVAAIELLA